MKKAVKIGFPIACVVIVGGTLIALSNLQNKVEDIKSSKNEISNSNNVIVNETEENKVYYFEDEYEDFENNELEVSNNQVEDENTVIDNKQNVDKESNVVSNNKTSNNKSVNTTNNNVTSDVTEETQEIDNISDKERAIEIVQGEWGSDPSVYFTNEGMSAGNYIVAVRDKSNTSVKMFYKVNLETGTAEIDW